MGFSAGPLQELDLIDLRDRKPTFLARDDGPRHFAQAGLFSSASRERRLLERIDSAHVRKNRRPRVRGPGDRPIVRVRQGRDDGGGKPSEREGPRQAERAPHRPTLERGARQVTFSPSRGAVPERDTRA